MQDDYANHLVVIMTSGRALKVAFEPAPEDVLVGERYDKGRGESTVGVERGLQGRRMGTHVTAFDPGAVVFARAWS